MRDPVFALSPVFCSANLYRPAFVDRFAFEQRTGVTPRDRQASACDRRSRCAASARGGRGLCARLALRCCLRQSGHEAGCDDARGMGGDRGAGGRGAAGGDRDDAAGAARGRCTGKDVLGRACDGGCARDRTGAASDRKCGECPGTPLSGAAAGRHGPDGPDERHADARGRGRTDRRPDGDGRRAAGGRQRGGDAGRARSHAPGGPADGAL